MLSQNPPIVENTHGFLAWLAVLACSLVLIAVLVAPASAETYTGTLQNDGWYSINHQIAYFAIGTITPDLRANAIETTGGTIAIVHYDMPGYITTYSKPLNYSLSCPLTVKAGTRFIGNGTVGFQRNFDNTWPIAIEQPGFQWMAFDEWNITGLSGTTTLSLTYPGECAFQLKAAGAASPGYPGSFVGLVSNTGLPAAGYNTWNRNLPVTNEYSITLNNQTMLLSGRINKTIGGITYNTRGIIARENGTILTSQGLVTGTDWQFGGVVSQPVYVRAIDSVGQTISSGLLSFPNTVPVTATPTPTPTITPTINPYNPPIPAGYVRSMAECVDLNSARISGCNIQMKDVQNNSWSNRTDSWGYWFIDTLPNHTVDSYGDKTGYNSAIVLGRGASGTSMIELFLTATDIPTSPDGYVNFFVLTNDYDTGAPLDADVSIRDSKEGYTEQTRTGSDGKVMVLMSNLTMIYITAEAPGYVPTSATRTTTAFGPDTVRIELHRAIVTTTPAPTATPPGWTPTVTQDPHGDPGDPGYSNAKGQEMMDWMAQNGMELVQVCFMVTILALLGIRFGR